MVSKPAQLKQYPRFSASDRMEHIVLLVSFTMLALTGLPQRYADTQFARDWIDLLGGIESIRFLHRFFATMLMAGAIYHGGTVTYKIYVRGVRLSMLPTWTDVRNVWEFLMFNLGFRKAHPKMPRYNFGEKAEYLALVWGTIIMIITGFMLWNPIATTEFLPGVVVPIARLAHSAEALLAVLSIIIWHMYNVHIKRFNRAMFTGKISHEEMVEEHALELEAIQNGTAKVVVPPEILEKRKRRFWPYAVVMTTILTAGLIWFVTFEDTALETVPRQPAEAVNEIDPSIGDAALGAELWETKECSDCHGEHGEGVYPIPAISNTELNIQSFAIAIRRGPADMPAYSTTEISDEEIAHLYAYLTSTE